jgi:hypothetical protein
LIRNAFFTVKVYKEGLCESKDFDSHEAALAGGREKLLATIREVLARVPLRQAYYPGARERWQSYLATHPKADRIGTPRDGELPWVLAVGLDPRDTDDVCFTQEAFCGLTGETALEGAGTVEFLDRAVYFANETLWGTLNVGLIVRPASLRDPRVAAAVERAIEKLRFGSVAVNQWAAAGYAAVTTPWGAYSGGDIYDVNSGIGEVHNTLMFSRVQKNVIRGPFRVWPVPPWFPTCRTAHLVGRRVTEFEAKPSLLKILGVLAAALCA